MAKSKNESSAQVLSRQLKLSMHELWSDNKINKDYLRTELITKRHCCSVSRCL
jgi:hypothetical protein